MGEPTERFRTELATWTYAFRTITLSVRWWRWILRGNTDLQDTGKGPWNNLDEGDGQSVKFWSRRRGAVTHKPLGKHPENRSRARERKDPFG